MSSTPAVDMLAPFRLYIVVPETYDLVLDLPFGQSILRNTPSHTNRLPKTSCLLLEKKEFCRRRGSCFRIQERLFSRKGPCICMCSRRLSWHGRMLLLSPDAVDARPSLSVEKDTRMGLLHL